MTQKVECFKDNSGTIHESEYDALRADIINGLLDGRPNDKVVISRLINEILADRTSLVILADLINRIVPLTAPPMVVEPGVISDGN